MNTPRTPSRFVDRLRSAGVEPDDSDELRQQKALLVFITGLVSVASSLWLAIYWALGPRLSASLPFGLQVLLVFNIWLYIQWGNFQLFRVSQLALLLFFPFAAQWAMGDFVSASGLILWGLLSPIVAMLCVGVRESVPWFVAYVVLTLLTGATDYFLADMASTATQPVSRQISVLFFALNFVTISALVYLSLRFALLERARVQAALECAHARLAQEQAHSERLLLNILPSPIAERLKHSSDTIADGFAEVTVMFADIVNFTELAAGMSAADVFRMLNGVFSHFDELAEARGLEKIKTIGDAYMVAGGLNDGLADPCGAVAALALDMHGWLASRNDVHALQIRVGIGTGPVVAGVVGKKKFIYDLWGDTVNLANRITSEGLPCGIQCDQTTYERLRARYRFDMPDHVPLKGKGMVPVWRLLGPIPEAPATREDATQPLDEMHPAAALPPGLATGGSGAA
ncbi:adenylate/guanylate cyclase domain-containing protein [Uliginosibacterium sp. sgz301328]|uniref:adenylate/guanylate cyclase domain-containing protein n=1 Tax=Uliginosibacterium sp. sgz301328 TaxID=3243764 RepID=UPI00359EFB3C